MCAQLSSTRAMSDKDVWQGIGWANAQAAHLPPVSSRGEQKAWGGL